jgi:hypothetical protein
MIPQIGQHIRCLLRNNLIIDGIVESWSDAKSVLRSLDNSSVSIIQHSSQDIVVIKIILKEPEKLKSDLSSQFEEEYAKPSNDQLRLKNMAELKTLLNEQEKKIIAEKLKEHHVNDDVKKVTYGTPGFFKKTAK